jgi:antitoxin component of MazEF toxin-antitoxin module
MFIGKLRREGDDLVVEIPEGEVQRLRLAEGQTVNVEVHPVEARPNLSPRLRAIVEDIYPRAEAGLRYLADR